MKSTVESVPDPQIAAVRQFNRLYTRTIGILDQHLFKSPFSLTEARVLYELAHRDNATAKDIGADLALDAGYLSRIVQDFTKQGLITRTPIPSDRRQHALKLTAKGRAVFSKLNTKSHDEVAQLLATLSASNRERLIDSMRTIERMLAGSESRVVLRSHGPGDMGWVVQQNGAFYASEFDWDNSYEALAADIVSQFLKTFDPAHERCWIAEVDGDRAGSVFLVRQSPDAAKLRLLLVTPTGRGLGLGRKLVGECITFARACGYRKITLWTQSILLTARQIYKEAGFVQIASEPHHSFGKDLIGETWELQL